MSEDPEPTIYGAPEHDTDKSADLRHDPARREATGRDADRLVYEDPWSGADLDEWADRGTEIDGDEASE